LIALAFHVRIPYYYIPYVLDAQILFSEKEKDEKILMKPHLPSNQPVEKFEIERDDGEGSCSRSAPRVR